MLTNDEIQTIVEQHPCNFSRYLKKHHKPTLDYINDHYQGEKFSEKVYRHLHANDPHCGKCNQCGKDCTFYNITVGFANACSYACHGKNRTDGAWEERECVICGKTFEMYKIREKTTCSPECLLELNRSDEVNAKRVESVKRTNLQKYGVEHSWQAESVKEKLVATWQAKYGVSNPNQSKEVRNKIDATKLARYGDKNYNNQEKNKATYLEKYGVDNYGATQEHHEKFAKTNLERYGVVYPIQNEEILHKAHSAQNGSSYRLKQYTTVFGDVVHYQSSYELKFIQLCELVGNRILNGDRVPYEHNGKSHKYFIDFKVFEPEGIRLVEIKRKHKWWFRDLASGVIRAKANAAIKFSKENGFLPYKILLKDQ